MPGDVGLSMWFVVLAVVFVVTGLLYIGYTVKMLAYLIGLLLIPVRHSIGSEQYAISYS
jgi:hypothetical protein